MNKLTKDGITIIVADVDVDFYKRVGYVSVEEDKPKTEQVEAEKHEPEPVKEPAKRVSKK